MAYMLWQHHLKHNPRDPSWADRDRFVLSAGPVEFAEKFITQTFEEGLAGAIVMEKLEEVLEWQRAAQASRYMSGNLASSSTTRACAIGRSIPDTSSWVGLITA